MLRCFHESDRPMMKAQKQNLLQVEQHASVDRAIDGIGSQRRSTVDRAALAGSPHAPHVGYNSYSQ